MKTTNKLIIFIFTFLVLATTAHAQSPREQLNQMVQQLQKNPNDNALREKIIKLGAQLRPAVPEEAEKYEGRAKFAFKNAKSTDDYADAAKEYEKAVQAAPWIPGYYSDLCTIYEKAGQYVEAKRNCEIYVKTLADRSQISETRQRIAGLEFGIEKTKQQTAADEAKYGWILGKWRWVDSHRGDSRDARNFVAKKTGDKVEFFSEDYPDPNSVLRATFDSSGRTVWEFYLDPKGGWTCPGNTGWVRTSMTVSSDRQRLNYQYYSHLGECHNILKWPNEVELRKR